MSENPGPQNTNNEKTSGDLADLDNLGQRISALRAQNHKEDLKNHESKGGAENQGIAQAMRVGAELLSALMVGVGIGWGLDQWLDTTPWLMLIFFFLGSGAGILNVYRSTGLIGANDGENGNNTSDSNDLGK